MKETPRRQFLAAAASVTAISTAGCTGETTTDPGEADTGTTDSTTTTVTVESTTATATTTTTDGPATTKTPGTTTGRTTTDRTTTSARIVVEEVSLDTNRVQVGRNVGVTAMVHNPGETAVEERVTFTAGEKTAGYQLELGAGDEIPLTFDFKPPARGVYRLRVNGTVRATVLAGRDGYRGFKYDDANTGLGIGTVPTESRTARTVVETSGDPAGIPVSDGEIVYFGLPERTQFAAVDAASGETQWTVDTGHYEIRELPVLADGTLYVVGRNRTDGSGRLWAWSATDGSEVWKRPIATLGGMAVANNTLYVTLDSIGVSIGALDPSDGSVKWTNTLLGSGADRTPHHISPPAVVDGTVYATVVTDRTGMVFAVDTKNRERSWQRELGGTSPSPPVVGDRVYVRSADGIHSLGPENGEKAYSDGLEPGVDFSNLPNPAPALANGTLFGCSGSELQAYDLEQREQRWTASVGRQCGSASPVVVDDTVLLQAEGGTVFGVDATNGDSQFEVDLSEHAAAAPVFAAGGRLVAVTGGGVHIVEGESAG